jgi:hypothetical protein
MPRQSAAETERSSPELKKTATLTSLSDPEKDTRTGMSRWRMAGIRHSQDAPAME